MKPDISADAEQKNKSSVKRYVAPDGDDTNPGTLEKPFATLARARDAVRAVKKAAEGDLTVLIRGGTYTLTETLVFGLEDSGSEEQGITYAALPGEEPVFSSGVGIGGWTKLEDYREEIPEAAHGKIWVTDVPKAKGGKWRFRTLYDGENRLPRARSKGFKPTRLGAGDIAGLRSLRAQPEDKSILHYPEGALKNWPNLEDIEIEIFPGVGFTMNILGLASVDEAGCVASTSIPATYVMGPVTSYVEPLTPEEAPLRKESVWVENVLEALDQPGEWVLNTQEGKLYLWPTGDSPSDDIVAPALTELIRVEGNVDHDGLVDEPAGYLIFRGLTFTHGDRDLWTLDDAAIQHDWEMYDKPTALVRFRSTEHCLVDECRFTNSGGTGLRFDLYSQHNTVQRSLFEHLGQAGVFICGYGPGVKDVSYRNQIVNNRIHRCGQIYGHCHGIMVWQSSENRVANNLIHDMPRKAVLVAGPRWRHFVPGNEHVRECHRLPRWSEIGEAQRLDYVIPFLHVRNNVVERNHIYNILSIGEDGGGINLTGNGEGNIVRQNIIHDIANTMTDAAIRLDGTGRGTLISENIIYDCACPAINARDRNNYLENNVLIDVSTRRNREQRGHFMFGPEGTGRFQRNILYDSNDSPKFFLYLQGAELHQFEADFNVYYSAGDPAASSRFLQEMQERVPEPEDPAGDARRRWRSRIRPQQRSIAADPLFVDVKNKDFRLRPESPAFKLGFKPIDTSKIGLTEDFPKPFR